MTRAMETCRPFVHILPFCQSILDNPAEDYCLAVPEN